TRFSRDWSSDVCSSDLHSTGSRGWRFLPLVRSSALGGTVRLERCSRGGEGGRAGRAAPRTCDLRLTLGAMGPQTAGARPRMEGTFFLGVIGPRARSSRRWMGEIETMGSRIDDDDAPLGDGSSTPPTGTPASSRASGAPPALDVPPAPGVPHAFAVPPAPPVPSLRLSELDSVLVADLHPGPEPEEHTSPGVAPPPEPLYAEGAPPSSDRSSEQVSDRPSQRPTRRPGPQVVVGSGSHASRGGEENYAAFAARAGREGADVEGAVRDGAVLESAVLESAVRDGAGLESAGPLEAAAMNVIEEASVAAAPLPSPPNDLEEPV